MSFILLGILNSQAAGAVVGDADFQLLETTVLTANESSVEFTGLDSYTDYDHLQLRATVRGDNSSADDFVLSTFNSDISTSYASNRWRATGSAESTNEFNPRNSNIIAGMPAANTPINEFAAMVIDIFDFSDTSKNTTMRTYNAESDFAISMFSSLFFKTDAVTSFQILPNTSSNFVTGSRFSLYGLKAGA